MQGRVERRWRESAAAVAVAFVAALLLLSPPHAAAACTDKVVYVSPQGDDSWSGRCADPVPDRTDGPVETLTRARNILRTNGNLDTAMIRKGVYYLGSPLELSAQDSGTTFRAAGGENVRIKGGEKVRGWVNDGNGISSAPVSIPNVTQVTINDRRQHDARFPDFSGSNPLRGGWLFADEPASGPDPRASLTYRPGDVDPATLAAGMKILVFPRHSYTAELVTILSTDPSRRLIRFTPAVDYPVDPSSRYYLFNSEAYLNKPGEWWFDNAANRIRIVRPPGFPAGGVVASAGQRLFELNGADEVTIRGLTFSDTSMQDNDQAAGAVDIVDGLRNVVTRNSFLNVAKAVRIDDNSHSNVVSQNDFSHLWGSAVELLPATNRNVVVNNRMRFVSEVFRASGAVRLDESWGNRVAHNLIKKAPRWGIGEGHFDDSLRSGGNVFEYNQIVEVGRETPDVGAIYNFANQDPNHLGNTVRFNYIRNSGGLETEQEGRFVPGQSFSWGIYLDDYTDNTEVRGNFVDKTAFGGVMIHGGSENTVVNNLLLRAQTGGQVTFVQIDQPMLGNNITRNIVRAPKTTGEIVSLDSNTASPSDFHHNLYYNPFADPLIFGDRTWEQWQADGGDPGSLIAHPRFVGGGDFRLRASSPAFGLGYQELPWGQMGLQAPVGP